MLTISSISPSFGNAGPWEKVLKGNRYGDQVHLRVKQLNERLYQADCFAGSKDNFLPIGSARCKLEDVKDWITKKVKVIIEDSDKPAVDELIDSIGK